MSDMNNGQPSWFAKYKTLVIAGIAVAIIAIVIFGWVQYTFSVKNQGEKREQDLTALYNQSLNSLGTCLDKGKAAAQVTEKEFDSLKEILVETAGARYDSESTADAAIGSGQLFSMVAEAYPTIDQSSWKALQTVVVGCRDEYKGTQDHIQASAATYNKWRVADNLFNAGIKDGFPSDELVVTKPDGTKLYGQAAYDHITRVVTVAEANAAFEDGELGEQDLFGDN